MSSVSANVHICRGVIMTAHVSCVYVRLCVCVRARVAGGAEVAACIVVVVLLLLQGLVWFACGTPKEFTA